MWCREIVMGTVGQLMVLGHHVVIQRIMQKRNVCGINPESSQVTKGMDSKFPIIIGTVILPKLSSRQTMLWHGGRAVLDTMQSLLTMEFGEVSHGRPLVSE